MTHIIKPISLVATIAALGACGGTGGGDDGGGPVLDQPTPPGITTNDVTNAERFISGVNNRRDTPGFNLLPTGTATYSGEMVTGLILNGENSVDGLIGDVRLTAQLFAAGDGVTGTISNIHTLNGDTPVERLSGQLNISGELDDGTKEMTSTLNGQLIGVVGDGARGDLNVAGSMRGRTQDTEIVTVLPFPLPAVTSYENATGIAGSVSGSITGSESGTFSGQWAVSQ